MRRGAAGRSVRKCYDPRVIYFVRKVKTGQIKIGYSANVRERMRALRAEHGPLDLLAVIHGDERAERAQHERWAWFHSHLEWFNSGAALLRYIEGLDSCEPVGPVHGATRKTARSNVDAR